MRSSSFVVGLGVVIAVAGVACSTPPAGADDTDETSGAATAGTDPLLPADVTPPSWNVETPADAPTPGNEPINVILTTDFRFSDLVSLLGTKYGVPSDDAWKEVQIGTGFRALNPDDWKKLAKGGACISPEYVDPDGSGRAVPQEVSLRVAGCFPGVLLDGENHVRAWEAKRLRRSAETRFDTRTVTTWYLAVSQEHLCDVPIGGRTRMWHCILPVGHRSDATYRNNGMPVTAPTGGYDKGRDDFVDDLTTVVRAVNGYDIACRTVTRPPSGPTDSLRVPGKAQVPWDGKATHCTVLNTKYARP